MWASVMSLCVQCPHLSQTREQYVDTQSPDRCGLQQIDFTVGHPQQDGDAHHLDLVLIKANKSHVTRAALHTASTNGPHQIKELTGSRAKACGRMAASVSQALVCSMRCSLSCSALFRGPVKTSDQNRTT